MTYKILPGSPIFDQLIEFKKKCEAANAACREWMKSKFPDSDSFLRNHYAGGLYAIKMSEKPDGWKEIKGAYGCFAPKAALKPICKEMSALPRVDENELKRILDYGNYSGSDGRGIIWNTIPALNIGKGFILIETSTVATTYVPKPEMIEILQSEYDKLIQEIKDSKT